VAQKYIGDRLLYAEGPGKGVVLEVKEQPGYGTAIDVILYDGIIQERDIIVLAGANGSIVTRVRAILMPKTTTDIRVAKTELRTVELVSAAAGIRIVAPGLEDALAGSPLYVVPQENEVENYKKLVQEEVEAVRFRRDVNGVVIKADTLGTLEAIVYALTKNGIPVRIADVGPLTKRDVIEASLVAKADKYLGVILLFNTKPLPEAEELAKKEGIKVFSNNIIYRLVEEYIQWVENEKKMELQREFELVIPPGKIKILPGFVFRRSDPAIVGVEVVGGLIKPGNPLMRADGKRIGEILQIQHMGQTLKEARMGQEVAISIRGNVMVGRHIHEGDVLYTDVPLEHAKLLATKFRSMLTPDSIEVLKEILKIKASKEPEYMILLKNL
ncbi:MAG: translation initiation factor IF-2, partial [Ignisphaera sp.]